MARLTSISINDTGAITLPAGTTAQRGSSATTVAQFTTVQTTSWTCPAGVNSVEVLVVGGGGGGGRHSGGGGGGGGVVYRSGYRVIPGTVYTVIVGGGGAGATIGAYPGVPGGAGSVGGNSQFDTIIAYGGGGGGWNSAAGGNGGSGGGGTGHATYGGGTGVDGQGFAGGPNGYDGVGYAASGGGGAGGPGQKGVGSDYTYVTYNPASASGFTKTVYACGGAGGPGVFYNISGQERAYGGGGGGNIQYGGTYAEGGSGGSGVGGDGSPGASTTEGSQYGYDGIANTGGGGGGSHYNAPASATAGRTAAGGSGIVILRYNTDDSLGATTGAARVNTSTSQLEFKAGDTWKSVALPFLQRTIISTAYMLGGYANGSPWQNVNRCVTATDTTSNLGNLLEAPTNYKSYACSKNLAYQMGATSTNAGASNYITAFNMRTESSYTSAGSRYLTNSAAYNGTAFKEHYKSYTHAGATAAGIEEFNMITETTLGVTSSIFVDYSWAMSFEHHGLFYASDGGSNRTLHFATVTAATRMVGTTASAHHQQKSVNSKVLNCYAGNEGSYNGGNNYRRTNMITDVTSGTVAKPSTNCGEENYTLGQEWQYMLGTYNGSGQVNVSSKFFYATETGMTGGTTMEPKGQVGASSGTTAWRD